MGRSTLERVSRQGLLEVLDLWAERPEAILRDLNFIFFVAEEAFESLKLNEITFLCFEKFKRVGNEFELGEIFKLNLARVQVKDNEAWNKGVMKGPGWEISAGSLILVMGNDRVEEDKHYYQGSRDGDRTNGNTSKWNENQEDSWVSQAMGNMVRELRWEARAGDRGHKLWKQECWFGIMFAFWKGSKHTPSRCNLY